ncbi:MAG: ATP phosphoribosyltransferase [Acidobacteria bacterium]|nr:ATP phosphoribosyltransferase [Acidobacteriota bacterium]MCB9398046.1 ATP phosphoribosyltransferase [Acidobacteriota bacterium]
MKINLVIPKGRMFDNVATLMDDIGISIKGTERNYRPYVTDPRFAVKLLKSQNIPVLVSLGQHDCGFAGLDWIAEQNAEVIQVLDLGFDPVEIVACIPEFESLDKLRQRPIIAVSEYRMLTTQYLDREGLEYTFLQSYGATEVFPPEDADLIVDNTATGSTIKANRLKIVGRIMSSSTQFIACPKAMDDPDRRQVIEDMALLFRSVLEGRKRVLLEMNCPDQNLQTIVNMLPAMKSPTICKLFDQDGYSVKAAVLKDTVRDLVPKLRFAGATDILETPIRKVIP